MFIRRYACWYLSTTAPTIGQDRQFFKFSHVVIRSDLIHGSDRDEADHMTVVKCDPVSVINHWPHAG